MAHPLDGARLKVRRASKHFKELNATIQRFVQTHPYTYAWEEDAKTGLPEFRVHALGVDEQPPPELGVIVGDIAHNLRSALDHVACQLAILNNATCDETQFPLCKSKGAFTYEANRRLAVLLDRHRTMIARVQPYHRRKGGLLLGALRDLSNADKHRIINPATSAMSFVPPRFVPPDAAIRVSIEYEDRVRMKDGALYLRFSELFVPPGTQVKMGLNTSYNVTFGQWGRTEISAYSIGEMRDYVRRLVTRFSLEF